MSCICRRSKCYRCLKFMVKPVHKMNDSRRYCVHCGANIGITNCKGERK